MSWETTKQLVHERAKYTCEYCQTAQALTGQAMHIEHIIPNGDNHLDNLCLSCANCNLSKARAVAANDPQTGVSTPLFNPRNQLWTEHFEWTDNASVIAGKTPTGRATIIRLKMNQSRIVSARLTWIFTGKHPPS